MKDERKQEIELFAMALMTLLFGGVIIGCAAYVAIVVLGM